MRRVLLLFLAAALAGCGAASDTPAPADDPTRLNIVFVLTDDLRADDIEFMPNVLQMAREGASFSNYIVSNSLCCPSRASIHTGQLPHNTGVLTNSPPRGGNKVYEKSGAVDRSFANTLRNRGYRTALFGKYLNGYNAGRSGVPPGWTDWAASARAYQGFDYTLNVNGTPRQYGEQPEDYMTDVLAERGERFLDESLVDTRPFFLELSTFTPHLPAVPAPRHVGLFPKLRVPRGPAFNRAVTDAPLWLATRSRMSRTTIDEVDSRYRNRLRSLVSIDEMVGRVRQRLEALGMTDRTLFVFSSDNGFHMGERRLLPGKTTAFDEDIRVPLIAVGPGVPAGFTVDALTQNTDLAPTFETLAGQGPSSFADGRSLVPLLRGQPAPADWRVGALVEHSFEAKAAAKDPDAQSKNAGKPPTYFALRTHRGTYVEYRTGEREFYDSATDPAQVRNAYAGLTATEKRDLNGALRSLVTCVGAAQCATLTPPARRAARAAAPGPRRAPRR